MSIKAESNKLFLISREFRNKQKHREANNPAPAKKPPLLPQQPLPDPDGLVDDTHQDATTAGDNFSDLVSKATSGGGRFLLKSERDWNKDIALGSGSDQFAHFFDLDVQQLALAIGTIPFHERFNLDDVPLTTGIREQFKADAAERAKDYHKKAVERREAKNGGLKLETKAPVKVKATEPAKMPIRIVSESAERAFTTAPEPKEEDIQGWLDDILDLWEELKKWYLN